MREWRKLIFPEAIMLITTGIFRRNYNVVTHRHFKIADKGLMGGAKLLTGNRISEFGNKSRRRWYPSMQWESLYSEELQQKLHVRTRPLVLKAIDSVGGLDNYILGQRRLESSLALTIKHAVVLKRWQSELQATAARIRYPVRPFGLQQLKNILG